MKPSTQESYHPNPTVNNNVGQVYETKKNDLITKKGNFKTDTYHLFIDTKNDFQGYGAASTQPYRIDLSGTTISNTNSLAIANGPGTPYRNVVSIELKGYNIPLKDNVSYYSLHIDEITGRVNSGNNLTNNAFAVLFLREDSANTGGSTAGDLFPIKGQDFSRKIKVFNPPIAELNRLSLELNGQDGTVLTSNHQLLFEITTISPYNPVMGYS